MYGNNNIVMVLLQVNMFDDEFMNDMLLNPDLYGMEDEEEKYNKSNEDD